MSKTIEEIKEEVSREFLHPYRTWLENSRFSNDDNISVLEDSGGIDEVVKRYAQYQTQKLQDQNAELVEMLEKSLGALNDCCMVIDSEDEVFEYIKNLSMDITKVLFNYKTKINVK